MNIFFILFPIIIPIIFIIVAHKRANRLISKESARSVLRRSKFAGVFSATVGILLLLFEFSLITRFHNLFEVFKYEKSFLFELAPYFILAGILIEVGLALYIVFSKSIEREFEEKLLPYKDKEQIRIRDLSTRRLNLVFIPIMVLPVAILFVFQLLPMYMAIQRIGREYSTRPISENHIPSKKDCVPTSQDVEGPYFRPNAPVRTSIAPPDAKGERLLISGTIYHSDCKTPVTQLSGGVPRIEVWHADNTGEYDNKSSNYWYRGIIPVDSEGFYQFETVRPGNYLDGGGFRPAHIHFKITIPGYRPLTTQLYFKDDAYLGVNDSCGSCNSEDPTLVIKLAKELDNDPSDPAAWFGTFNIVLEPIKPQGLDTTETSGWQTYRNDEFGFEVKYPEKFVRKELPKSDYYLKMVFFEDQSNSSNNIFIEVVLLPDSPEPIDHLGIVVELEKRSLVGHATDRINSERAIEKDGYEGVELDYVISGMEEIPFKTILIEQGDYIYKIISPTEFADQILSTFRFIK